MFMHFLRDIPIFPIILLAWLSERRMPVSDSILAAAPFASAAGLAENEHLRQAMKGSSALDGL
jgi:hypothetical protein